MSGTNRYILKYIYQFDISVNIMLPPSKTIILSILEYLNYLCSLPSTLSNTLNYIIII